MFNFNGYGKVETVKMGEGTGVGLKTNGKFPHVIPLYIPERISRPEVGSWVACKGEVTMSKKGFLLLRVDFWQSLDGKTRCVYTSQKDAQTDAADDSSPNL
jgi:hypothetical protein